MAHCNATPACQTKTRPGDILLCRCTCSDCRHYIDKETTEALKEAQDQIRQLKTELQSLRSKLR